VLDDDIIVATSICIVVISLGGVVAIVVVVATVSLGVAVAIVHITESDVVCPVVDIVVVGGRVGTTETIIHVVGKTI
jgi:hypothetical protein